jgi:arsenate reductase
MGDGVQYPVRVLFVCIGNSCRSPMAEGFARHKHSEVIEASSAGTHPASIVQPETISAMAELGVPLEGQQPQPLTAIDADEVDLVVNMSGMTIVRHFPDVPGNLIWQVPDPIGQSTHTYRKVRDQIETLVEQLAETLRLRYQPTEE